jgi:hypothetical protein
MKYLQEQLGFKCFALLTACKKGTTTSVLSAGAVSRHEERGSSNKKVEGWCWNLDHGLWINHSRFQIPFSERGSQIDEMIEVSLESSHPTSHPSYFYL